jgi:uncharacterized membrane protein
MTHMQVKRMLKMIVIEEKILINAPPKEVWKLFSNLDNWPKFNPMYKYAKQLSEDEFEVGSHFEFYSEIGMIKSKSLTTVLRSEPPNLISWMGSKKILRGKHTFAFNEVANGTEVTNYEEFTGPGIPLFLILGLKSKMRESFKVFLKGLKKECER